MTLAIIGAVVVVVLLVLDRLASKVLAATPRPPDRTVPDTGVAHEDLVIQSGDHLLGAWLLKPETPALPPLVLLAHGWGANYSIVLRLAEPLVAAGYEVLLFDVRGHGRNEPVPFVTVRHFRDDMIAVTAYARERFPERKLVTIGHSLGGAAAVLALAEGAPMDGLALIATPSSVTRVTAEFLTDHGMPGPLMVAVFRPFWWRRAGSLFGPLTPSRRIREVTVPLVILQPENDLRVPRRHAEELSAASGVGYDLVVGCEHTDVLESPETHRLVCGFLERVGGRAG